MGDARQKVPFRPGDLFELEFVSDPQVSADATSVAYVRTTVDRENNKYHSAIYVVPVEGGAPVPFTSGLYRDSSPRWSPDGRLLAFLSNRDTGTDENGEGQDKKKYGAQLYLIPTQGGEARRVTDMKGGIGDIEWSPDGSRLAFVSRIDPDGPEYLDHEVTGLKTGTDPTDQEEEVEKDEFQELFKKYNRDVKHLKRVRYRFDGMGYLEEKRSQVFVLDVAVAFAAVPGEFITPTQVTSGEFDHQGPAWSPDGSEIAVSACRDGDPDRQRFSDLWVFPVDGSAEPRKLTTSSHRVYAPRWSGDGDSIAYLANELKDGEYTNTRLHLVDAAGTETRCVTADFDRSLGDSAVVDMRMGGRGPRPVWAPGDDIIYVTASDHGMTHLFAIDVETGGATRLTTGDMDLFQYDFDARVGTVACAVATAENPNNIYVGTVSGATPVEPRKLTNANADLLSKRVVVLPERYTFHAPGGPEADGWVVPPVGVEPGKKYPAVLEVHGGPTAMYSSSFFFEFQLLAASGIGVIYTNPRGSQGYGEEFCSSIAGDWGNKDYADVMAGVDEALRRFDWVDGKRLGVAGGSYGGYMTSWVIGHTDRFAAAVSMRAVNNCYSMFGTSDIGYFEDQTWGNGHPPWESPDSFLRQSPIAFIGNATTPTLVIHSENDFRCPIEQGEQMYRALKKLGVDTEFLRYPGESHGLSRGGQPWHRVHRLKNIVDWFERYLGS